MRLPSREVLRGVCKIAYRTFAGIYPSGGVRRIALSFFDNDSEIGNELFYEDDTLG